MLFLQASSSVSGHARKARSGGKRILIVEDDPFIALGYEALLKGAGFDTVGPASTVEEAMTLIRTAVPDAVLLDCNLGGRAVDEVAALLWRKGIPFVFATAYGLDGVPRAFRGVPALRKPFADEALSEAVGWMMWQQELRRAP